MGLGYNVGSTCQRHLKVAEMRVGEESVKMCLFVFLRKPVEIYKKERHLFAFDEHKTKE